MPKPLTTNPETLEAAKDLLEEEAGEALLEEDLPETITHVVVIPTETATFFYGKFLSYITENNNDEITFASYLGGTVLGGLHALMEGRVPGE